MSHEYIPPSEIDGGPAEVERKAIDQLAILYEEVAVQARNAYLTRLLDQSASLTPEHLAERWEGSDRKGQIERVRVLIGQL